MIDGQPFYEPKQVEDHVSVLGLNYIPLTDVLIQALINHPDLVPDNVLICWTIEQELLLETTMEKAREQFAVGNFQDPVR